MKERNRGKAPGEKERREPEFTVAIGGGVIGSGQSPWRSLRVGGYRQNEGQFGPKNRSRKPTIEPGKLTVSVSSLAQIDITVFTAILNPPQNGILTVGKLEE